MNTTSAELATDSHGWTNHVVAAKAFGVEPKYRVLKPAMLRIAGFFDSDIRESYEMLYQYEAEYLFDSTKFSRAFDFRPTAYEEGVAACAAHDRRFAKS